MEDGQKKITLLYVEDDPEARELVVSLLRRKYPHLSLLTASDGMEGVAVFKEHGADIVVTDINMPAMNGIEMSRQMKEKNPEVLIIGISAYHDGEFMAEAATVGFHGYVTKPVEYRKLFEEINSCIEFLSNSRGQR